MSIHAVNYLCCEVLQSLYVAPQMQNGHAYGVWRWN